MPLGFAFKALTGQAAVDVYCNIWDYIEEQNRVVNDYP
jgi:hypothetical protein